MKRTTTTCRRRHEYLHAFRLTAFGCLVTNLQSAFVTAAWGFSAIGFILNLFGYEHVMMDCQFSIDAMETSQFQQRVIKATKSN
jgi:hypothetical protein